MKAYYLTDAQCRYIRDIGRRVGAGSGSQKPHHKRRRGKQTDAAPSVGGGDSVLGVTTAAISGGAMMLTGLEQVDGSTLPSSPLEVENPFGFDIDSGGLVWARKKTDGVWIALQAECPG